MLKPVVLLGVFGAGVAIGAIAMRAHYAKSSGHAAVAQAAATPVLPLAESPYTTGPEAAAPEVSRAAESTDEPASNATAASNAVAAPTPPPAILNVAGAPGGPIDVGPALEKVISRASEPGYENQIGDAHRALERETRDEGWAYTMESEIESSIHNEMAASGFKTEHIECRATLCEVRLSGTGPQQAAGIRRWNESFIGTPSTLGQKLFLNFSSSVSNDDRTETLLIFRKPPPAGSAPSEASRKRG